MSASDLCDEYEVGNFQDLWWVFFKVLVGSLVCVFFLFFILWLFMFLGFFFFSSLAFFYVVRVFPE